MKNKPQYYIVYDGRAIYDVDEAQVLECLDIQGSDEQAMELARASWADTDSVLVAYDLVEEGDSLINERVVGAINDNRT